MRTEKFANFESAQKFVTSHCERFATVNVSGCHAGIYGGRRWFELVSSRLSDEYRLAELESNLGGQWFGYGAYSGTFGAKFNDSERQEIRLMTRDNWAVDMSVFVIMRGRVLRFQSERFDSIITGGKRLNDDAIGKLKSDLANGLDVAADGMTTTQLLYAVALKHFENVPVPEPVPEPIPEPVQAPVQAQAPAQWPAASPDDMAFAGMLRKTFAQALSENLVDDVMPTIKKRVIDEFGFEPVRHEVIVANETRKVDGVVHEKFNLVVNLVANDQPVYLYGPCGSGKGFLVKQVAKSLGLDFYAMNSVTDEFKISGFIDANGHYQESEFYRAFTNGGVFFLDEMDASAPEVLVCLNMAIADRYYTFPTGRVDANPNFRVVAAGNTIGTGATSLYTGRMQLDAATLNRFAVVFVDYDEAIELNEADNDRELVAFIHKFRGQVKKGGLNATASYRNISMLRIMSQFASKEDALSACLLKDMNQDDINMVASGVGSSTEWGKALSNCKAMA